MVRHPTRRSIVVAGLLAGLAVVGAGPASAGGGGGGGHCPDPLAEATGTEVEMQDACFTPATLHVAAGELVTFRNLDPFPHNIAPAGWRWGHIDDLRQGETYRTRFDDAGVYPFACSLHPGMTGAIVVEGGMTGARAGPHPQAQPSEHTVTSPWWLAIAGLAGLGLGASLPRIRGRQTDATPQRSAT